MYVRYQPYACDVRLSYMIIYICIIILYRQHSRGSLCIVENEKGLLSILYSAVHSTLVASFLDTAAVEYEFSALPISDSTGATRQKVSVFVTSRFTSCSSPRFPAPPAAPPASPPAAPPDAPLFHTFKFDVEP